MSNKYTVFHNGETEEVSEVPDCPNWRHMSLRDWAFYLAEGFQSDGEEDVEVKCLETGEVTYL